MDSIIKSANALVGSTEPIIRPPEPEPPEPADESDLESGTEPPAEPAPDFSLMREELEAEFEQKKKRLRREYEKKTQELELRGAKILEEAHAEAEAIRETAHIECERLKQETLAQAEQDGYAEGLKRAEAETNEILLSAGNDANRIIEEAHQEKRALFRTSEGEILRLSLQIAEKILGLELDRNDAAFISLVEKALLSVGSEKHVTLRVSREEYDRFFRSKEAVFSTARGIVAAEVQADPAAGPHGLLIETEQGGIDAGVPSQLAGIETELERFSEERKK